MWQLFLRSCACVAVFACAGFSADASAGWLNLSDEIAVPEIKSANPPAVKYAATIHALPYTDGRVGLPPKNVGISTERIFGISGDALVLDRKVADLVTAAVKRRFENAGFQFVDDGSALYELSGVVKELTYNVKARDEISIAVETTLKEVATGKVVWSGLVVEKDNRFAGVSGNSKGDVADYLRFKLGIVTQKTYDAVSGNLIATRPDLFNLVPGTKPISGVTVLFKPAENQPASGVVPVVPVMTQPKTGMLILTTKPARAKVYMEGVYFGMSPLHAEVEVGVRNVSVKLDGYKTATEKISIRKDDTTELELVLEK